MSLFGRACASRSVQAATSPRQRPAVMTLSLTPAPSFMTGAPHRCLSSAAAENSRNEILSEQISNAKTKSSWSGWEVAAVSLLAAATSASMVVYPTAVKNEPSADGATANASPFQGHSVSFVHARPNHRNWDSVTEKPYNDKDDVSVSKVEADTGVVTGGKSYDISVRAIKGNRVTMEDEYFVADGGRFCAVFDGHGGGGVSAWLRAQLYKLLKTHLKETHWEEQEDETDNRKPSLSAHVGALRKAFAQVEKDVVTQETLAYQGSTAVSVLLHESDDGHRTLISANVGDSRAILSRRGKAVDLTRDHKPNEEREKARILNMGEVIEWDSLSKVHRVRNLSLSRAIGDRYAKPVVSSQVEIKLFPVAEDGDEFFLLASDGLWDVMTSQDVVSYVHQRFEKELSKENLQSQEDKENYKLVLRRNMARSLAREALRRGTGDNICVLMVWMQDLQDEQK